MGSHDGGGGGHGIFPPGSNHLLEGIAAAAAAAAASGGGPGGHDPSQLGLGSGFGSATGGMGIGQSAGGSSGSHSVWMFSSIMDSSRVSTFLISMLLIVYGSFRSLNMEQESKGNGAAGGSGAGGPHGSCTCGCHTCRYHSNNNTNQSSSNGGSAFNGNESNVQTLDTMQALCLPLGASVSLLVMFFFFDSMQLLFAMCTAVIAAVALAFLLLPMCEYLVRLCYSQTQLSTSSIIPPRVRRSRHSTSSSTCSSSSGSTSKRSMRLSSTAAPFYVPLLQFLVPVRVCFKRPRTAHYSKDKDREECEPMILMEHPPVTRPTMMAMMMAEDDDDDDRGAGGRDRELGNGESSSGTTSNVIRRHFNDQQILLTNLTCTCCCCAGPALAHQVQAQKPTQPHPSGDTTGPSSRVVQPTAQENVSQTPDSKSPTGTNVQNDSPTTASMGSHTAATDHQPDQPHSQPHPQSPPSASSWPPVTTPGCCRCLAASQNATTSTAAAGGESGAGTDQSPTSNSLSPHSLDGPLNSTCALVRHMAIHRARRRFAPCGPLCGRFTLAELISFTISVTIVCVWILTGHWLLMDAMGMALCVAFIAFVRLPSLKVSTLLLTGLLIYDVFWVFFSSYIFSSNVMVRVATRPADNPVNLVARRFHLGSPGFGPINPGTGFREPPKLSLPGKLIFPSMANSGHFSMLGLGDIVMPGLLLCFVLRYDAYKKAQARKLSGSSKGSKSGRGRSRGHGHGHNGQGNNGGRGRWSATLLRFLPPIYRLTYFHCSLMGYFLGLVTATVSSEVFKAAQPALLYLVPFTLLPLLTMAYLKGDLGRMWSEPFESSSPPTGPGPGPGSGDGRTCHDDHHDQCRAERGQKLSV